MRISKLISGAFLLAGAAASQAQSLPVFKIGVVTAATGAAATIAAPANQAIELYREQLAALKNLPFKVEFIQYDDASDPTKSVNLVRKLIQEDGAAMVVCCTTTPSSLAVAKVAEDAQTATIAMAASAAVVEPASEKRYMFKTPITERLMINHTLDYMVKQGVKTLSFLGLEDAYGEGGWIELKALAEKKGIKIVSSERFARQDTNFTPQALKTVQAKADAVYIHAIPPSASLVHEALKRVGYRGPIYHGAGAPTAAFITIGKSAVEGAIVGATPITVYKDLRADNPLSKSIGEFVKAFDGKYGAGKAEIFATQGYDAVGLAVDTVKRYVTSGKKGDLAQMRKDLRDELEKTHEYAGSVGIFNYTPTDHVGLDKRTLFLVQVKDGQFRMIKD
ncbi:ABC transporter substrate-binding protein [Variovorax terrae]|uniref:ABC transporter substrate-binding protein n=1 Tax=Variovorax terrae TaxID=2923278 RepID=A0A9X2AT98_9BURK|nr:ABC transporter substrate-binding protein [Variovorax terrae]MCJ0766161.1 ABC transporter substrate-binding protein [Variovorax terrae]